MSIKGDTHASLYERWQRKTVIRGPECWPWTGATNGHGYGVLGRGGRGSGRVYAHRVAFEQAYGPIPVGLTIDHLCRNRWCQNPTHMEPVTAEENARRGNPIDPERWPCGHQRIRQNTYPFDSRPKTKPRCRTCLYAQNTITRRKRRARQRVVEMPQAWMAEA